MVWRINSGIQVVPWLWTSDHMAHHGRNCSPPFRPDPTGSFNIQECQPEGLYYTGILWGTAVQAFCPNPDSRLRSNASFICVFTGVTLQSTKDFILYQLVKFYRPPPVWLPEIRYEQSLFMLRLCDTRVSGCCAQRSVVVKPCLPWK